MLQKRKFLRIIVVLLVFMGIVQTSNAQSRRYAKKVVRILASSAYHGRGYVEGGDKKASEYIKKSFEKWHLLPLNNGSYFQNFDLSANTFPGKVEVKINGKLLVTAVDYLVGAASPSVHGTFGVQRVTLDDLTDPKRLKSAIKNAKGSFLLIDETSKPKIDKDLRQFLVMKIKQLEVESSLDCKGLIVYTKDRLMWTSKTFQNRRPLITINTNSIDPKEVRSITVDIESVFIPKYTTRNVCAMVKGTSKSDSTLVITAHYDHLGLMGRKVYFPGANDNASGTAMLLSFARYYSSHAPKYNTVFLAFAGEEIGLLGSKAYVASPLNDLRKIKFLVNFDMAGTGIDGIEVVDGTIFRTEFDKLVSLNNKYKLLADVKIRGESRKSDHYHFYEKGVPAYFIYTLGGINAYHDIFDRSKTLPMDKFHNYFELMRYFFDSF